MRPERIRVHVRHCREQNGSVLGDAQPGACSANLVTTVHVGVIRNSHSCYNRAHLEPGGHNTTN